MHNVPGQWAARSSLSGTVGAACRESHVAQGSATTQPIQVSAVLQSNVMDNAEQGTVVAVGAGPADLTRLRTSYTDRETAVNWLQRAAAEGRINLAELEERLGKLYNSTTYAELDALFTDLPASHRFRWSPTEATETLVLQTAAPNVKQGGRWVVPRNIVAESKTGFITIDFTAATCAYDEVAIKATTASGRIRLILPAGWAAHIDSLSSNTAHITNRAKATAEIGGTTIVVTGHPSSGYIKIKQRKP